MSMALDIADYIINICNNKYKCGTGTTWYNKYPISNLYLQKIMYFLNATYLIENGHPLVKDDKFETWDYGPVLYDVYKAYQQFGGNQITHPVHHFVGTTINNNGEVEGVFRKSKQLNKTYRDFIKANIKNLLKYQPFTLVDKSHQETQWKNRKSREQQYNDESTIKYYTDNEFWEKAE